MPMMIAIAAVVVKKIFILPLASKDIPKVVHTNENAQHNDNTHTKKKPLFSPNMIIGASQLL